MAIDSHVATKLFRLNNLEVLLPPGHCMEITLEQGSHFFRYFKGDKRELQYNISTDTELVNFDAYEKLHRDLEKWHGLECKKVRVSPKLYARRIAYLVRCILGQVPEKSYNTRL